MGHNDDSSNERRRKRSRKPEKKRKHEKSIRRNKSSENSLSSDSYRKSKRRRNEHKITKRSRNSPQAASPLDRNYALADALCDLFDKSSEMATDLPLFLIRLSCGTSFDLNQMPDKSVGRGLARVFDCLGPFGVVNDGISWTFQPPLGNTSGRPDQEFLLLRVVRGLLHQIGLTMDAFGKADREHKPQIVPTKPPVETSNLVACSAQHLLLSFEDNKSLPLELASLVDMILQGESVSLDGLPNDQLRESLEQLFEECGLERAEMEADSDNDEGDGPAMGYSLPEVDEHLTRSSLALVMQICQAASFLEQPPARRPVHGPLLHPAEYGDDLREDSSDDEGPLLEGIHAKLAALPPELIQVRSKARMRQLKNVQAGVDANTAEFDDAAREEWMLDPGKFDLFASVKAGQPLRNRGFAVQSKGGVESVNEPVDPKIQAEINTILQIQQDARGPTLLNEHRRKKAELHMAADSKKDWQWNRDKDLDAGRRVDKDNLNLIFGGAADNLKKKFSGGLG